MKKNITVTFEPEGLRVNIALGTTIFHAANEAGVPIRSECGGKGICGKCKVVVRDRNAVTEVTTNEEKQLSLCEINTRYRLACQAKINQDAEVMVPLESRIGARKYQVIGLERSVPLKPLVKKFHIVLPKPTPSDNRPDFERLLDCLKGVDGSERFEIDYDVLKKLPGTLREANWNITIVLWDNHKIVAVENGDTTDSIFGLAIDIGTSKVVGLLVDLKTGKTLGVGLTENPQLIYGEDVISRIAFAMDNDKNLEILQKSIVESINDMLRRRCSEAKISPYCVYESVMVGNTAMHHLLLGITPKYVALSPYVPARGKPVDIKAEQLDIKMNPCGIVHVLPVIAGFVGADAVADILSSGIYESEELSLLLDIGTNTEIFVGNAKDLLCCSCASGPAFEGAHIKNGVKAVTGAIEKVRINQDYEVVYEVIGDSKPIGLCGSAVIDVVAEMLKHEIIDYRGRFNHKVESTRFRISEDQPEFVLARHSETAMGKEITVTQKDINEIQLAKAAIYAGCAILLKRKKVMRESLDRVLIAGAFGNYLNPENAKTIGLIPDVPAEKIMFIGNTAVTGAKMALISKDMRRRAELVANRIRYLELSCDLEFNKEFTKALRFPHKNGLQ